MIHEYKKGRRKPKPKPKPYPKGYWRRLGVRLLKIALVTLLLFAGQIQAQVTKDQLMGLGMPPALAVKVASISSGSGFVPSSNIVPAANNSYNIGSTGTRFSNIYSAATVFAAGVRHGAGTAGSPSSTFETDTDTGLYRVGANALGISTGGTRKFTINSTGELLGGGTATLGWAVKAGANTACTTTCITPCVFGVNTAATEADIVGCADATADECLCAGAS